MKKFFVLSIMLLATVSFAIAQQGQGQRQNQTPEERAKVETERLEKLLTLTAAQKTKIQAIELEISKERSTLMQNSQGNREAMRESLQKLSTKRDTKFKEVLTADQFKKYQADNEQRQRERGQRGQGGGQGGQRNN